MNGMRAIDADTLMKRLKAWDTNDAIDKALYNFALNRVLEAPTVEPERKKGCKIVKGTGHYGYCACDQCGKPVHPEDKFCSNCGADFREEDA